jgi:hypothetical protein
MPLERSGLRGDQSDYAVDENDLRKENKIKTTLKEILFSL